METKFEILNSNMIAAMKNKDIVRRDTLRSVIGNIKKVMIDKKCEATDSVVDEALLKEIKIIKEQIETCPEDRVESLADFNAKLKVVEEFAPKLKTDPKEIEDFIRTVVANNPVDVSNAGSIMKTVMPHLKGKCDMKVASQLLRSMNF